MTNVVISFVMMPFLVSHLGLRDYGFWSLVGSIIGFYGFLDFGLSSAVSRFYAQAKGQNDHKSLGGILSTSFFSFSAIAILALLATLSVALGFWVRMENHQEALQLCIAIILLGSSVALEFPFRSYMGLLYANLNHSCVSMVNVFALLLRSALIFVLLPRLTSLITLASIVFAISILRQFLFLFFLRKEPFSLLPQLSLITKVHFDLIFRHSAYSFINQLANMLRLRLDSIVISSFLGVSLVGVYAIAAQLINYTIQFIMSLVAVGAPLFSRYQGAGRESDIEPRLYFLMRISSIFSMFILVNTILFGNAFLIRWLGEDFTQAYPSLVILMSAFYFEMIQYPAINMLVGLSRHNALAKLGLLEGAINLGLSLLLAPKFGLIGVALGTSIPLALLRILWLPKIVVKNSQTRLKDYYALLFSASAKNALIISPMIALNYFFSPISYINIAAMITLGALIYFPITYLISLRSDERKQFIEPALESLANSVSLMRGR